MISYFKQKHFPFQRQQVSVNTESGQKTFESDAETLVL